MFKYQRKRADADVFNIIAQQARIGIRNDQADNQDSEHIEQQNTPEYLPHRAWNVLLRIFGLTRRDTNQLGPLEGEADNHRHTNHCR